MAAVSPVVADVGVLDSPPAPQTGTEQCRLMDAALHVMRRNGFQGASVQDILDHAGLSTRAFYRQFRSKDDLLLAMFRTASDPDVAQVARWSPKRRAPLDAVLAWVDEMVSLAFDRRRVRRLVIFNAVARQADGYEEEESSLRSRSRPHPCSPPCTGGPSTAPSRTPTRSPDASTIFDLVWSVAHPQRRPRSMDRSAAKALVLRFCLPALGVCDSG